MYLKKFKITNIIIIIIVVVVVVIVVFVVVLLIIIMLLLLFLLMLLLLLTYYSNERTRENYVFHPWIIILPFLVIDSFGKPLTGLFDLKFKWLGSFDECVTAHSHMDFLEIKGFSTENVTGGRGGVVGQYCTTTLPVPFSMVPESSSYLVSIFVPVFTQWIHTLLTLYYFYDIVTVSLRLCQGFFTNAMVAIRCVLVSIWFDWVTTPIQFVL